MSYRETLLSGGRPKAFTSNLAHLDVQGLNSIADLAWCHTKKTRRLGLYPTGLLQGGDHPLTLIQFRIIQVDLTGMGR